jgi:hypothetical protein
MQKRFQEALMPKKFIALILVFSFFALFSFRSDEGWSFASLIARIWRVPQRSEERTATMQPGRKTFCQPTEMSIGKFSLDSETSPGGEHYYPLVSLLIL